MLSRENVPYYAPFLFFLAMLLDGQIARVLNSYFQHAIYFHSYLVILTFVFASFVLKKSYLLIAGTILGMMMDSYYVGIIGLYVLGLPLIILMAYFIFRHVKPTLFSIAMALIIFVTFMETSLLLVHVAFSFIIFHPVAFITKTLGPTIFWNLLLLLLTYPFMKKLFPRK